MTNAQMSVNGNILTITVDLTGRHGVSSTGKSTKVASTEGNVEVPNHPELKIGLNVYAPIKKVG